MKRWRAVRIPRTIHRVWLGAAPMPDEHERFGETFAEHHRGWEMRLWTEPDLPMLGIAAIEHGRSRTHSELANLARYEILHRFGGIYVDTDVECRRSFTPLLGGIRAFAALESPGRVGNAVLGAIPGHPVFARAARLAHGPAEIKFTRTFLSPTNHASCLASICSAALHVPIPPP